MRGVPRRSHGVGPREWRVLRFVSRPARGRARAAPHDPEWLTGREYTTLRPGQQADRRSFKLVPRPAPIAARARRQYPP